MDVFRLRDRIILEDYAKFSSSFIHIADERIKQEVEEKFGAGVLWPAPLLQLNPSYESGGSIQDLVSQGVLDARCAEIFRIRKNGDGTHEPMELYKHQTEAIIAAQRGDNYVLTTGTGSGKSLSYIIPIVNEVLKNGSGKGIQAVIVYPMNALANSQEIELEKFLNNSHEHSSVIFKRYTGQEIREQREEITSDPPDILLTNYVMLELILTRPYEKKLVEAAKNLRFLVFDELHTYRGRQGADVAMLIRRLRETLCKRDRPFQCVGTSATLAGPGTFQQKRDIVARVASRLFGDHVSADNVIVETLQMETGDVDIEAASFVSELRDILSRKEEFPDTRDAFIKNPLVVWIEKNIGAAVRQGRVERCQPRPLRGRNGLAESLSRLTGVDEAVCESRLKQVLIAGSGIMKKNGKPVFAFKLHQFISKGDTVYATIEPEDTRAITLFAQKSAPDRKTETPLFALCFCRECGKEFYSVTMHKDRDGKKAIFTPLNPGESQGDGIKGYLFISKNNPWPDIAEQVVQKIPEDWIEEKNGKQLPKRSKKSNLPDQWFVRPDGSAATTPDSGGTRAWFLQAPFVLCPECLITYDKRVDEFSKLGTLGTEGRSTATTILSMSAVNHLHEEPGIEAKACKFLCFSDNRQDASLQAGHFNDFVQISLIRSALYNALARAGDTGVVHDVLPECVLNALGSGYADGVFPPSMYSNAPRAEGEAKDWANKTFRDILEYYIYTDLRRGWRIVAPNLEQCGLLNISYPALDHICGRDVLWRGNDHLFRKSAEERKNMAVMLLDLLRSRLAIYVDCLKEDKQEQLERQSRQRLVFPWVFEEREKLISASYAYIYRQSGKRYTDPGKNGISLSPKGNFGRWLKGSQLFPKATNDDIVAIIDCLVSVLCFEGVLVQVNRHGAIIQESGSDRERLYQLKADAMLWKAGDGKVARRDPFKVRSTTKAALRSNDYFVDLYRNAVKKGYRLHAHEHTAQVLASERAQREEDFRSATLPVLFCSPTMELGIDISELNVVGMRNVPPTSSNYAQRSGRAGRSGQPALVITYCAQSSSHDQYFFRTPEEIIAGSVTTPRIDLANEELIRAHVYALWLAASGLNLRSSLSELLKFDDPSLPLEDSVKEHLNKQMFRDITAIQAGNILKGLALELQSCDWYSADWLKNVLDELPERFEQACERWRDLYSSAREQYEQQHKRAINPKLTRREQEQANRLSQEAYSQMRLLMDSKNAFQADFYSYRYFASEGFLPGYNFPRLPLSAYIPGSSPRKNQNQQEYISRPRFLAISEFGPASVIYHEGCKYSISKVIMGVQDGGALPVSMARLCNDCGWLEMDLATDLCAMCGSVLPVAMTNLFRMRNVVTRQRARITSDEEERMRFGYRLVSGYRFEEHGGMPAHKDARLCDSSGIPLALLKYGHGATLWRINMGWIHSKEISPAGFLLDKNKGIWLRDGTMTGSDADVDLDDPAVFREVERVIPYVEDRKNCLVITPEEPLEAARMHSLLYALKQAIQRHYQLEDGELLAELMPSTGDPKTLFFVEASEGGAGVLRHLVEDKKVIGTIAKTALDICHFDAQGNDLGKALHAAEICVSACYDCLMNYKNQRSHKHLNRHCIKDLLLSWMKASLIPVSKAQPDIEALKRKCDSELERSWLDFLHSNGLRLPDDAQYRIDACNTVVDFWYAHETTAIYIDGPWHGFADRQARDQRQQDALEDMGISVIRFDDSGQWMAEVQNHPALFGYKK